MQNEPVRCPDCGIDINLVGLDYDDPISLSRPKCPECGFQFWQAGTDIVTNAQVCDVFKFGRCDRCDHPCPDYFENHGYAT